MTDIVPRIMEFIVYMVAAAGLISSVAVGVYDFKATGRRSEIRRAVHRLARKSFQPSVTVVVYTYNDAISVVSCLQSVRSLLYKNYEVIIVDDASRDGTVKAIRDFMRKHPKFSARLYVKKKHGSTEQALKQAYAKSRRGDNVITLSASSRPSPLYIRTAVARFIVEPDLVGISPNQCVLKPVTLSSVMPQLARATRNFILKCLSLFKSRRKRIDVNGIYRRELLIDGMHANIRYKAGLLLPVSSTEFVNPSLKVHLLKFVSASALLFMMTYAMLMAASLVSYLPMLLGWLLVTIGSLAVIWSDEGIRLKQKLQLTFSAGIIYFLLSINLFIFILHYMFNLSRINIKRTRYAKLWPISRRTILKKI